MDTRLITLLVVIAIVAIIGFMTKWTFRFRRSTYDEQIDISEEELDRIEQELEAEMDADEGYEMYEEDSESDSDSDSDEGEEFVE